MFYIKDSCSGCHACELNCPAGACFYDGPKYQIDQEKCIGCAFCATVCPDCVITVEK